MKAGLDNFIYDVKRKCKEIEDDFYDLDNVVLNTYKNIYDFINLCDKAFELIKKNFKKYNENIVISSKKILLENHIIDKSNFSFSISTYVNNKNFNLQLLIDSTIDEPRNNIFLTYFSEDALGEKIYKTLFNLYKTYVDECRVKNIVGIFNNLYKEYYFLYDKDICILLKGFNSFLKNCEGNFLKGYKKIDYDLIKDRLKLKNLKVEHFNVFEYDLKSIQGEILEKVIENYFNINNNNYNNFKNNFLSTYNKKNFNDLKNYIKNSINFYFKNKYLFYLYLKDKDENNAISISGNYYETRVLYYLHKKTFLKPAVKLVLPEFAVVETNYFDENDYRKIYDIFLNLNLNEVKRLNFVDSL